MSSLTNKNILLGITGGIAAYKAPDLVRRLQDEGANVRVVLTRGGEAFITPLTLQAVSGQPVHQDLLDPRAEAAMGHIELARWADLVLVAPATASFMARLANGFADDLLSTLCLATRAPVVLAPAMNSQMWLNAATQYNKEKLHQRDVRFLGPGEGDLACGETGPGRMLDVSDLIDGVANHFVQGSLCGVQVLITAGPTREAVDPVRFVSNRSSGKMGYAMAEAARDAGAEVCLVSGPVSIPAPDRVELVQVESAEDMFTAVMRKLPACDIFIATAAVADYRPISQGDQKIKKTSQVLKLDMERTKDILAEVASSDSSPFTLGFAAETQSVAEYAQSKLKSKKLDMIAANKVGPGQGFDSDENELSLYWRRGEHQLAKASKRQLAVELIEIVSERYHEKN